MKKPKKKDWLKAKGYLHITNRINISNERGKINKLVKNPSLVAKHAFCPLFHKKITERRYKVISYTEKGTAVRNHSKFDKKGKKVSTKKIRPIHYATHIDAQIYSYYSSEILQKKYESELIKNSHLSECILAYRRIKIDNSKSHKNNIHFAKEIFDEIKSKDECVAFAFDIENFFSSLNHKHLKKAWCQLLDTKSLPPDHYNIFKSITNFSYINLNDLRVNPISYDEKKLSENRKMGTQAFFSSIHEFRKKINDGELRIYKNQFLDKDKKICGIPQGLAISAMLANLYLFEFDKEMYNEISIKFRGIYRRYSDDIAIVCPLEHKNEIESIVEKKLKKYHLNISSGKTEICRFKRNTNGLLDSYGIKKIKDEEIEIEGIPLKYLGFEFNGRKILIKSKNLSKFYRRMKYAIKSKAKRIKILKEKNLLTEVPIYKRKIYRSYTDKGSRSKKIIAKISRLEKNDITGIFEYKIKKKDRKYWGNFIGYAYRASKIMGDKSIKRQVRNHKKILKKTLKKYFG